MGYDAAMKCVWRCVMALLAGGLWTGCGGKVASPVAEAGPVECVRVAVERTGEQVAITLRLKIRNAGAEAWKIAPETFALHAGTEVVPVLVRPFSTQMELQAGETGEGEFRYWGRLGQLGQPLTVHFAERMLGIRVEGGISPEQLPEGKMVVVSGVTP